MEKLIYLVWDRPSRPGEEVRAEAVETLAPQLIERGAQRVEVFVNEGLVAGPMPAGPSELPVRQAYAFWVDAYDRRGPLEELILGLGVRSAGYLVTESTYCEYGSNERCGPRTWPVGQVSPGISTFSLLRRNPAFDARTFREFWHLHQSPMSEALQPRLRYLRHTVVHAVTAGAPPYDAIVHEAWPDAGLLSDIVAFHNGDEENLRVMLDSVAQVFDLGSLRSEAMGEYLFWSPQA
jgi:hypothetical protein